MVQFNVPIVVIQACVDNVCETIKVGVELFVCSQAAGCAASVFV